MELRTEIIEAQKARADLFKWKIILVATLGAVGLGVGIKDAIPPSPRFSSDYLFCIIPLVCLYVDMLCSHMNLRMMVIGHYLRLAHLQGSTPSDAAYEDFAQHARAMTAPAGSDAAARGLNAYAFEDFAQSYSTLLFCLLVFSWGVLATGSIGQAALFLISGAFGIVATLLQSRFYARRVAALDELVASRTGTGGP